MKKLIVFILGLFLFQSFSFAQNIVQEGKEWSFEYNSYGTRESSGLIYYIQDSFYVDSIAYKGLYASSNKDKSGGTLLRLLREENGKVFTRSIFNNTVLEEGLLYDFNVKVGDTVSISYIYQRATVREDSVVAVEVSTVVFEGIEQKKISVALAKYPKDILNTWYTGIGDLRGIIYYGFSYTGIGSSILICCKDSLGTLLYRNPNYNDCYYSAIENEQKMEAQITLSPNPVIDYIRVEINDIKQEKYTFKLYNSQGNLVLQKEIAAKVTEIPVKELPQGAYFYAVSNKEQTVFERGKIVKVK